MTIEETLESLDRGDQVVLTVSNTSEFKTETLEVIAPDTLPMLEGAEYLYQVHKHRGDIVLHHGRKKSKYPPQKYYAEILSVEKIEE